VIEAQGSHFTPHSCNGMNYRSARVSGRHARKPRVGETPEPRLARELIEHNVQEPLIADACKGA
jgi:hypothetical protein